MSIIRFRTLHTELFVDFTNLSIKFFNWFCIDYKINCRPHKPSGDIVEQVCIGYKIE